MSRALGNSLKREREKDSNQPPPAQVAISKQTVVVHCLAIFSHLLIEKVQQDFCSFVHDYVIHVVFYFATETLCLKGRMYNSARCFLNMVNFFKCFEHFKGNVKF